MFPHKHPQLPQENHPSNPFIPFNNPMLISHQNRARLESLAEDAFCLSLFQFPHLLPYSSLQVKDTYKQPVLFDAFYFNHRNTPDICSLHFSGQARCNQPRSAFAGFICE